MRKQLIWILLLFSLVCILQAREISLDIIFTNDLHGGIDRSEATFMNPEFPPQLGGGASAAGYIKKIRAKEDNVNSALLLADQGDFFQGRPVGSITNGTAIIKYMNAIGYDYSTIGNHEYDIPESELIKTLKLAKFPILSSNLVKKGTNTPVDYVRPYIIIEKAGIKIGIIGLTTTDTKKMSFPENVKNVDFLDEKATLEHYIPIVKAEGADLIFIAGHLGLPYEPETDYQTRYESEKTPTARYWGYDSQELAHEVKGIDLILGGHMHKGFAKPWIDPLNHTLVVQNYAYGSNIGQITLKIDSETKTIIGYTTPADDGALLTLFEDEFVPDPDIDTLVTTEVNKAEKGMDEVIGSSSVYLSKLNVDAQSLIGNYTCDAMKEEVGADLSFLNLGGMRAEIRMGTVTFRDVFNVMPFDNQIVTMLIDGTLLKKIFETRVAGSRHGLIVSSGCNIVYSRKRDDFDRVTKLLINGKPVEPDKIYKVATTDFLLQGNAGLTLLTQIPETQIIHNEINLRDAMVNYFKKNSPVHTKIDDRWSRNDKATPTKEVERLK